MKTSLQTQRVQGPQSPLPPVYVTYIAHRKTWVLLADYEIAIEDPVTVTFRIPIGFEFDLASIPRAIWPIIGSFELSIVAPLIHDYLYQTQGKGLLHRHTFVERIGVTFTRKQADDIFLALMLREQVPAWKARAAYAAVRLFAPRW